MTRITLLLLLTVLLNSCASGYKKINPTAINYSSKSIDNNIALEYKYDLLFKKYKKKETKNDVKLIAVKISNNSENDVVFGQDFRLFYENGNQLSLIETEKFYKTLKQSPASYLWYLLLSPIQIYSGSTTSTNNGYTETKPSSSFPIGLIAGPGLAAGNMIAAGDANHNFKNDLMQYEINGKTIKKGETVYGLIGVHSNSYDAIRIKMQ
ncbi:hypothetical protein [Flavobacterium daemonense]|uniref:hypothetical protein n=1 Tax=Flavobacterium daemonense TaxID=1393049 RepID=UPI00118577AE|nr:hypothetical protein [Flavobacterium daemonense]KAF2337259.1 hypothetical protein FND99_02265 [Flavobacterium daemonense]